MGEIYWNKQKNLLSKEKSLYLAKYFSHLWKTKKLHIDEYPLWIDS